MNMGTRLSLFTLSVPVKKGYTSLRGHHPRISAREDELEVSVRVPVTIHKQSHTRVSWLVFVDFSWTAKIPVGFRNQLSLVSLPAHYSCDIYPPRQCEQQWNEPFVEIEQERLHAHLLFFRGCNCPSHSLMWPVSPKPLPPSQLQQPCVICDGWCLVLTDAFGSDKCS